MLPHCRSQAILHKETAFTWRWYGSDSSDRSRNPV